MNNINELIKNNKINWICTKDKCPKNCCKENNAKLKNVISLFNNSQHNILLTNQDYTLIKKKVGDEHLELVDDKNQFIKCSDTGRCPFLNEIGKCNIYQWRGSSCKSYPFFLDKYAGLWIDKNCPGIGKGWTEVDDVMNMLEHLFKIYNQHYLNAIEKLRNISEK